MAVAQGRTSASQTDQRTASPTHGSGPRALAQARCAPPRWEGNAEPGKLAPMALSVHDNHLVSYEVLSAQHKIVLRTEYRDGGELPDVTAVIFTGVEGYHFELDCFENILFDVERVPVARILEERAEEISAAARYVTWPWVQDLAQAHEWLESKGIVGFLVDSSVGLCGWVLAQDAVLATEPTTPSELRTDGQLQPGLYEVSPEGACRSLIGRRLIAALGDGRELAFTLPGRGRREDEIYVRSFFNGPGGDVQSEYGRGPRPETWSSIVVHPGGGNCMTLAVEARSATDGRRADGPAPPDTAPVKSWILVEGDNRQALQGRSFMVSLGEGRGVLLDARASDVTRDGVHVLAGMMPTQAEIERVKAGGPPTRVPMGIGFGGANGLHIRLGRPYGARPVERVRSMPKDGRAPRAG